MIQTHGHDIWFENCFDPKSFNLFIKNIQAEQECLILIRVIEKETKNY